MSRLIPEAAFPAPSFWQLLIVLSVIFAVIFVNSAEKQSIPDPTHPLIWLSAIVKSRFENGLDRVIALDAAIPISPISVMVLFLIVIVPVVVGESITIPCPLQLVIVLFVARNVKVSTGGARNIAEPPLLDIVFADAVISRAVIAPSLCR